MVATAAESSSMETEALSADEVTEHLPPSVLAQLLRTVRHHLAQATDGIRQSAARTGDGEWEQQATQLRRIAAFVEDQVSAMDIGQRSFLCPISFSVFDAASAAKGVAHLTGIELSRRAGLSPGRSRTSKCAGFTVARILRCGCLESRSWAHLEGCIGRSGRAEWNRFGDGIELQLLHSARL